MDFKEFLNACEERLGRVEGVLNQPIELQVSLEELEDLLRNEWPDAIISAKDVDVEPEDKQRLDVIFEKIKKLENNTKARVSFFNGIEGFMQQPRNR